jgi:REP element-mobilizing transposase RayT
MVELIGALNPNPIPYFVRISPLCFSIKDDYEQTDEDGVEKYEENEFPLAYLITFRTYGTWFHGDQRESVARDGRNLYGKPRIKANPTLEMHLRSESTQREFILTSPMRKIVEQAIAEYCKDHDYGLRAVNARSNYVHALISAWTTPERLADALKARCTKLLREKGLVKLERKIWSRGRSRRYLWKPRHVNLAIHYVLYCQDDQPFKIPDVYDDNGPEE